MSTNDYIDYNLIPNLGIQIMNEAQNSNTRIDISSRFKSEVITIRVNPKAKFGLELMARIHNRSVAQTLELAILRLMADPYDTRQNPYFDNTPDENIIDKLWSPHRGQRLLKMVLEHHELLSYDEELLWNNMARAGLLDKYFVNPAEINRQPIPENYNQRQIEDEIAAFWDEQDRIEKAAADQRKKEKKKE